MKNILVLPCLVSAFLLTACGGGSDSDDNSPVEPKPEPLKPTKPIEPKPEPPKPIEYVPSQYKTLNDNFKYVQDPLAELKNNKLYSFENRFVANFRTSAYNVLYTEDNQIFKTKYYEVDNFSSAWLGANEANIALVFNIKQNKWIESIGDLTVFQGPIGTEGIKTLKIQSDLGLKYYTLTEKSLEGLNIAQGIHQSFNDTTKFPETSKTQYFSMGAKAYAWLQDITQPSYEIKRFFSYSSGYYELQPIHTCEIMDRSMCSNTVSTLEKAIEKKAWYQGFSFDATIRLKDKQVAEISIYVKDAENNRNQLKYIVKYELIKAKQGIPKHILFTATDNASKEALKTYFDAGGNSQLSWFEYQNQVVAGNYSAPINGLQSTNYSYNKTAINDIILAKLGTDTDPVLE